MVKVKILGSIATLDGQEWKSEDSILKRLLTQDLQTFGYSFYDPNPNLTAAQNAVKKWGGEVLEASPVEYVKGRIY
jgi:hypothetical protein